MKNAVLGLVENYDEKALEPFVKSLRNSGYSGDIVFFVRGISEKTRAYLAKFQVCLIDYERFDFRGLHWLRKAFVKIFAVLGWSQLSEHSLRDWIVRKLWHCQASRYFFYEQFLSQHRGQYESILLCDVRDVIFQADPFLGFEGPGLQLFQEWEGITIEGEDHNRDWIDILYGRKVLEEMKSLPIICSGATLGSASEVNTYLALMKQGLCQAEGPLGYDQGVHNYICRVGGLKEHAKCAYGQGQVMNVGIAPEEKVPQDERGLVIGAGGNICPVIHQYDRHAALETNLRKQIL